MTDLYSANKSPIQREYKFLGLISMIYITLMLAANVLIYKIISVHGLVMTVGSFITPFWFITGDVVTEVYGYQACKRLIWQSLFCSGLFTAICTVFISIHSPSSWVHQEEFDYILGVLPRVYFGSIIGITAGSFLNAYLISKWKVLVKGRYFWLRSTGSSAIGLFIFTVITITLAMLHHISAKEITDFILISYTIKICLTAIIALPLTLLTFFLKRVEQVDIYDHDTNFNPLKIR